MAILSLVTLQSCSTDNGDVDKPADVTTTLTTSLDNLEVAAEGGTYSVDYTLTNGLNGIGIQVTCASEWITNITTTDTTITFTALANSAQAPRQATLTLRYPKISNQQITIIQAAAESHFDILISNATSTSCQSTVAPKDTEMAYIVSMTEVSYFWDTGITTAEQLFNDDHNFFVSSAAEASSNLGQYMIINNIVFYGQSDISWTGMTPNVDYVFYVYGITFNEDMTDYTMATPVNYTLVSLESGTLRDVKFDVDITVDGPTANFEFEPIDWSGSYYIDIYAEYEQMYITEGNGVNDIYAQTVADTWLQMMNTYLNSGYTSEQLVNIMCLHGKDSYSLELESNTKYMMSFYAIDIVDGIPQVVSRPHLEYFQTEEVKRSDMTFEVDLSGVYTRVADIRITPTNDVDPYTVVLGPTEQLPSQDAMTIMQWLISSYTLPRFKGEISVHENTLKPESDYTLLVFGYYGGVITTDLVRKDFSTDPEGECENSVVRVDFMGPYSPTELAEHYPDALNGMEAMYEQYGFYIMWAEIITEKPSQDVFYYHYDQSELAEGDEYVFNDLVSYSSDPVSILTARSGVEFVICAVTMDYRGNYSDMWKSEPFNYEYSAATKRPIEELLEKLDKSTAASSKSLVIRSESR